MTWRMTSFECWLKNPCFPKVFFFHKKKSQNNLSVIRVNYYIKNCIIYHQGWLRYVGMTLVFLENIPPEHSVFCRTYVQPTLKFKAIIKTFLLQAHSQHSLLRGNMLYSQWSSWYYPGTLAQLHEPRIFYPSGHWPETVTNAHVSAHFR